MTAQKGRQHRADVDGDDRGRQRGGRDCRCCCHRAACQYERLPRRWLRGWRPLPFWFEACGILFPPVAEDRPWGESDSVQQTGRTGVEHASTKSERE